MADDPKVTYQVNGVVSCSVSPSVGGLRVSIVDKNVSGDIPLQEVLTDDRGAYSASFDGAELQKRKKALPDLQVHVFAGETLLGSSEVRYNAPPSLALNVVLDKGALPSLRSEYEVLTAALAGHFSGKLGDLKENKEQQQITYLANKTGWDARAVALAALADQFSRGSAPDGAANSIRPEFSTHFFEPVCPPMRAPFISLPPTLWGLCGSRRSHRA